MTASPWTGHNASEGPALEKSMDELANTGFGKVRRSPGLSGLAWIGGFFATAAAAAVGAVLAIVFAASLLVIGLMAAAVIGLVALAFRAKRVAKPRDPMLIEARHVGGHSWVAYGWDQRGR